MVSSLRTRLTLFSIAITTISLLVLTGAMLWMVRDHLLKAQDQRMSELTNIHAADLAAMVKDKRKATSAIKAAVNTAQDPSAPAPDPIPMLKVIKEAGGLDGAFFVYSDKRFAFIRKMPADFDGTQRPWYKQAVATGGSILTAPYIDMIYKKLTFAFAEPVMHNGQVIAVVGSNMTIDSINRTIANIHPTDKSFAFLINDDGKILAYPKADLVLKPVSAIAPSLNTELIQQLTRQGGYTKVAIDGADHMLYAAKVEGTPWLLAIGVDYNEAMHPLHQQLQVAALIAVLCVLAAIVVVKTVVGSQLQRLTRVRDALQDIASGEGDLTRRISESGNDELTHIAKAFNQFVDKMALVLQQIRSSSDAVRMASHEIANGNQDLSIRTEQQASSLQQTATVMEDLTTTVQQNAENARQANQLASDASQIAAHGGQVVGQVVQTMGGIDTASRKIVDIISVIDGIAFQTNILALNAAVEAARAGEQGRGFAVVAAEVRTLAQRSANAAKEIKTLIDASVAQVNAGSQLVHDAGETMEKVVESIRRVSAIVAEISAASQTQSNGIAGVGQSVTLMDQSTQQNAALVEQAAAAAQSLQQQASQLANVVAGFKLSGEQSPAMQVPPARRLR
ncbi:methyl-accepting chemotaxis protein [Giesbergeria anulus]|uniref:Methyl-accepting chemotaxis sensory transducer with Cache sensor n=1 Tax=Giesbergeria anulus TaxID=180197 RepID=A0A1H9MD99_9BURK|nr:methyl-accepting chemotaxis protein [Giesbergeria anulus]SER21435.1 methyl-accepting chemotaxis sensory transducer with Cache sensor [Giesbergeria anulus]